MHAKLRLIYPSEKLLSFENGKYSELTGVGEVYEDKAPVQAMVLGTLKDGPMTVGQLVGEFEKVKGQISHICSNLLIRARLRM